MTLLFKSDDFISTLQFIDKNLKLDASELINNTDNEELRNYITSLLFNAYKIGDTDSINMQIINDCIKKNKIDTIKNKKRKISLKLNNNEQLETEEEKQLLSELQVLIEEEKKLKK